MQMTKNVNISMPLIVVCSQRLAYNSEISSLRSNKPGLLQIVASAAARHVVSCRVASAARCMTMAAGLRAAEVIK
jgi:hypothetical protein